MARKKLLELDLLAARVVRMRQALELGLKCGCVRIEDCTLSPSDVPPLEAHRRVAARADTQNV